MAGMVAQWDSKPHVMQYSGALPAFEKRMGKQSRLHHMTVSTIAHFDDGISLMLHIEHHG